MTTKILEVVSNYLANHQDAPELSIPSSPTGYTLDDMFLRIKNLYQEKDWERNIYWITKSTADGQPVLIRDARQQIAPEAPDQGHINYTIIAYSYLMALLKITELENPYTFLDHQSSMELSDLCDKIDKMLKLQSLEEVKAACKDNIDTVIIKLMELRLKKACFDPSLAQDEVFNQAVIDLDQIKKWVALEHPTYNFVTINKIESYDFAQIEQPLMELTNYQIREISKCNSADLESQPKWYASLSILEKTVFNSYREKIAEGVRVIPSQLRNKLPFLKNAFHHQTVCFCKDSNGEIKPEIISDYNHCGTIVYLNHKNSEEKRRLTKLNAQQQIKLTKLNPDTAHHVVTIALNSARVDSFLRPVQTFMQITKKTKTAYIGEDEHIIKETENASKEIENFHFQKFV